MPKLIFRVLVNTLTWLPCSVPSVIQKKWKKPHYYHVTSSSGVHKKDKRRTSGACCSITTSFGPSSAPVALHTGWTLVKKQRTFTSAWFLFSLILGYLQWLWELFMKFSLGHASRYSTAEQLTTAFSDRWAFCHFTELDWLTSCNPDEDQSELKVSSWRS